MRQSFTKYALGIGLGLGLAAALTSCADADATAASSGFTYDDKYEKSCQSISDKACRISAQDLSVRDSKPLPIVAYGGNKDLFETAKRVVRIFNDNGVRAYMLHAKDRDTLSQTMHVDFYTNGGTKFGLTAYDNRHISQDQTEQDLICQGAKAYREAHGTYNPKTRSVNTFLLPSEKCDKSPAFAAR